MPGRTSAAPGRTGALSRPRLRRTADDSSLTRGVVAAVVAVAALVTAANAGPAPTPDTPSVPPARSAQR
ncbi:hypothetical protein [Streptomyces sp. LaPpAH-108]|uniref:hypothetical protein n=1 Tax=Streptomyces sp. LaPpAH-108 TaxID=1155714 RepID=UPI00039C3843|nr:hypothetical protein [Streptomyces sp. LaPpAH-108]